MSMSMTMVSRVSVAVVILAVGAAAVAAPSATADTSPQPVRVTATPLELGDLGMNAHPTGISDSGVVVGMSQEVGTYRSQAFRWEDGRVIELVGREGDQTSVADVNSAGHACGRATGPDIRSRAVVWEPDGTLVELGGTRLESQAVQINELGTVAGLVWDVYTHVSHAVIWRKGVMTSVGELAGGVSSQLAQPGPTVNDRNQVVFGSLDRHGVMTPFVWDNGVVTPLPKPRPDASVRPIAINRRGEVTGVELTPRGDVVAGLLWSGTTLTCIPDLGSDFVHPQTLDDRGVVIGQAMTATGEFHAFAFRDGVTVDLGTLGGDLSFPMDINRRGQIVGYSNREPGGNVHVTLWDDGLVVDLSPAGPYISFAPEINRRGQIAGSVTDVSSPDPPRAYLWEIEVSRG